MKHSIWMLALPMILVLSGCFSLGSIAGSRSYTPRSDQEKVELERADRSVYPDDIRRGASELRTTTIAWPGIIQQTRFVEENDHEQMYLLVEHHYYDWIQDFGTYHGTYWLSPRGEGLFTTTIRFDKADLAKKTGLTPDWISHFETGRRLPSLPKLILLADAFDVTLDELVGRGK